MMVLRDLLLLAKYPKELSINFSLKLLVHGITYLTKYLKVNFGMMAEDDIQKMNQMRDHLNETIKRQDAISIKEEDKRKTNVVKGLVSLDLNEAPSRNA